MVIVSGHILVEPRQRRAYLDGCVGVVHQARRSAGCLDFAISADLVDAGRINVYERWESQAAVDAFRGSAPDEEQQVSMLAAAVSEYDVAGVRVLSGGDDNSDTGDISR